MKSQTVFTNKGFTLIEILVTIGLVGVVLAITSLANVNMYTRQLSASEDTILVVSLQKARSQAMNNISGKAHGVHFENGKDVFVVFEGNTYVSGDLSNLNIPRNEDVKLLLNGAEVPEFDIVFDQLSGSTSDNGTITLSSESIPTKEVEIKSNGLIIW